MQEELALGLLSVKRDLGGEVGRYKSGRAVCAAGRTQNTPTYQGE